jgi:hypothetical protein
VAVTIPSTRSVNIEMLLDSAIAPTPAAPSVALPAITEPCAITMPAPLSATIGHEKPKYCRAVPRS